MMMVAKRNTRRSPGKPPERGDVDKLVKAIEKKGTKIIKEKPEAMEGSHGVELPYVDVLPLPQISKSVQQDESGMIGDQVMAQEPGFTNRSLLQLDERARDLIIEALKMPINLTMEDLLNVSPAARQELKKLLTKKRLEKKMVAIIQEPKEALEQGHGQPGELSSSQECKGQIDVNSLLEATYKISMEAREGMPKGSLIINDPVLQYLSTMAPGEKPKTVIVVRESQGLRAVYPMINNVGEVESLLDGGSQIVSMAKKVAEDLEIPWDPDITVQMQSANRSLEQTLGLAKNVPFLFKHITVYLQVHVMGSPAYKVLLGRPFDMITESVVKNVRDGGQSLTLINPNTGAHCVMHTHE